MQVMNLIENTNLFKKIIDKRNIYYSIFSVNSYVFEKELLETNDYKILNQLNDKFNYSLIESVTNKVTEKLRKVLLHDELFETSVFFRPKKIKEKPEDAFIDKSNVVSRPLHVSDLYTQIAIATILNAILFDENKHNNTIELNELGRILPKNFYGNIPSDNPKHLFIPWTEKYKEYSDDIRKAYSRYLETGEYKHEITIDLENFFPSIQPAIVYRKIIRKLQVQVEHFGKVEQ